MKRLVFVVVGIVALAGIGYGVYVLTQPALPTGPIEVSWDREVCAFCRMHVGDPSFAVQLQTADTEVFNFDDTGCYFRYVAREKPAIHGVYFHHVREDRWLNADEVQFERVSQSPMGFGLGAVESGPLSLAAAQEHCLGQDPATAHGHEAPAHDHRHHADSADTQGSTQPANSDGAAPQEDTR